MEGFDRRRETDHILLEMHGMVQRLDQKMDDTHRWIKSEYEEHKKLDEERHSEITGRLKPIEDFHGDAKKIGKIGAIVLTPALLAVGAGVWEWIRSIIGKAH